MATPYNPLEGPRPDFGIHVAHPPTDDKVAIVVVHHNRPEFLNICLQSIAVNSSNNNYELVVVDNGSTRADALTYLQMLEEDSGVKVIKRRDNGFWSPAANAGARAAGKDCRYLVFMHDDTVILNPAWIDMLVNITDGEKSGLVGLSRHGYMIDNQKYEFIEEWCMMVTRECWEDCGPFEEQLPIIGAPFILSLSAHHAGYKPMAISMSLAHHYGSFSVGANEFERASYEVMERMPKIMVAAQQRAASRVAKRA